MGVSEGKALVTELVTLIPPLSGIAKPPKSGLAARPARTPPPAWFRGIAPAHLARACSGADFCLFQHRRHHPAAAEATQLLRAANSAAWCVAMPTPTPRTPPPIHARGVSPLAAWRASEETPRHIGQGDGVQATEAGSSAGGGAGSLQLVVNARPGHSSESHPTPWLRRPPTAPGRRPYAPQAPPQKA